jgi:type II secretory pathway component PulF
MPTFEYQAKRSDGTFEKGVVIGSSLDSAAQDLSARGLNVTQLGLAHGAGDPIPSEFSNSAAVRRPSPTAAETEPAPNPAAERTYFQTSVAGPLIGKVPLTDLVFFFRQSATMLKAGVGMVQTMSTLSAQARDPKLAAVIREISAEVQAGHPISASLRRYPEVVTNVVVSVLEAGERGGFVDDALETIADYLDQEIELRNLYRRATFMPKLELAGSIVVIIGANLIISSINDKAQKLSSPLTNPITWVFLGPLIVAAFLFFRVGLANPNVKTNWDQITSKIPYLGTTLRQIAMAKFGRAFAALYRAGVPLQTTLILAANACGNEYLKALIVPAAHRLEEGEGVAETLAGTNAFSPIVLDMVRTGETTGNLDTMLQKTADFYVEEAKIRQQKLGMTVGLFVLIFVCVYIGYIVISFYVGMGSGISEQMNGAG